MKLKNKEKGLSLLMKIFEERTGKVMNIWIFNHYATNPDEARKMGENGRQAAMQKYNWMNESKKLVAIYEELAS